MGDLLSREYKSFLKLVDKSLVVGTFTALCFHPMPLNNILLLLGFPTVDHVFMIHSPMLGAVPFSPSAFRGGRTKSIAATGSLVLSDHAETVVKRV